MTPIKRGDEKTRPTTNNGAMTTAKAELDVVGSAALGG
jgi:hypothetical protein